MPYATDSLISQATHPIDWIADTMMDRPITRVRDRLTAQLGNAVADSFQIVPSDRVDNQLAIVALLLPHHLPILVFVHDHRDHATFLIAQYDNTGRRLHAAPDEATRYHTLADAILASGQAFEQLKKCTEQRQTECCPHRPAHELPEERWLRHQLAAGRHPLPAFAAVHQGGGSLSLIC